MFNCNICINNASVMFSVIAINVYAQIRTNANIFHRKRNTKYINIMCLTYCLYYISHHKNNKIAKINTQTHNILKHIFSCKTP